MSIVYTGHCAYPASEAQQRIDYLRVTRPDWYRDSHLLTDAEGLGPFGAEIARGFGIEAQCRFGLHLLSSEWVAQSEPAVDFIYEVFGAEHLVITYGNDSLRPPSPVSSARDGD